MAANLAAPSGFTSGDLVFNDNFAATNLKTSVWNNYITDNAAQGTPWFSYQGGSGVGGQYEDEFDMPSQVLVNNGLSLDAVRKPIYAPNEINGAMIMQTYPVTSGVVSTYGRMELNGGYVQISMKEPGGNGSWPGLWLLPGSGAGNVGDNFEIDIQEGGVTAGGANPNTTFSYHLHTPSGTFGGEVDTGVDLTAAYHTYAINWVPGQSITWFLDGHQVATITSAQAPIPNEPMELIMSNQVANSNAAGWHTTFDSSTPQSMNMQVGDVQIYQAPGSGDTITGRYLAPPSGTPIPHPGVTIHVDRPGNHLIDATHTVAGQPLPTSGNDRIVISAAGNDTVHAGGGNDTLIGGPGNDLLYAGSGNDVLAGRWGHNTLVGGRGHDQFIFNTALVRGPHDIAYNFTAVADFNPVDDALVLSHKIFSNIAAGVLSAPAFGVGAGPHDTSERIIYNPQTGYLTYDQDGSGHLPGVVFGKVAPHLQLTHADFLIGA